MTKKGAEKPQVPSYEYSPLYREKKSRIQEMGYSDFIEFLNWVENVNKGKKKEDGKRIVDLLFNKYSDSVILSLFERFRSFKRNKPEGYDYKKILDEVKEPLRTEIYGDNVVKSCFFGWYGNYLKYIKRQNDERKREKELAEALKQKKKAEDEKEVLESIENEKIKQGAENRYTGDDRDIENEDGNIVLNPKYEHIPVKSYDGEATNAEREEQKQTSKKSEVEDDGQLKIPFEFED